MRNKIEVPTVILMYAFRYALGRKTGAPSTISTEISRNIAQFKPWELKQIVKEILEHEEYFGDLGDDCDKEEWRNLINLINIHLELDDEKSEF
jgi:hypothetical protein